MRLLAIDRSSDRPGFVVIEDKRVVLKHLWKGDVRRMPDWVYEMRAMLAEQKLDWAGFDSFAGGIGPGSFSGIRASLSFLNGVAMPGGQKVVGLADAAVIAADAADADGETVTVIGDARRQTLWVASYRVENRAAGVVRLADGSEPTNTASDFKLVAPAAIASAVPAGSRVVSPDWPRLEPVLTAAFGGIGAKLVREQAFPSIERLGRMVASGAATIAEPRPIYLHPAVGV